MKEPYWFMREECLALHDMMLSQYGGIAGLRADNLLESALARPRELYARGRSELAELAAAYAGGIIRNHPFIDGNKRTGFMLGAAFLERNGLAFRAPEAETAIHTLALAAGGMKEAAYAAWLREHSTQA